jgi:hypothetical protein
MVVILHLILNQKVLTLPPLTSRSQSGGSLGGGGEFLNYIIFLFVLENLILDHLSIYLEAVVN